MRAMVLDAPRPAEENPLHLTELPLPTPGPGEIRIRVSACGVCHTDLHIAEGDLPLSKAPLVLGHQVVGQVDVSGPGTARFKAGDRVGVAWLHFACGECRYCRRGQENLCENAKFTGYHADGGFAEYLAVPEAFAYRIPASFSDEQAAPLLCAGIIGYRALRLSGVAAGDRLGLYGFGASAHLAVQVARHRGCEVHVFTRTAAHKALARELGATWVGEAQDQPPEPLDAAVVFAPAGWIVPLALRAVRPGGTVVLAGIHMTPVPEMSYHLIYGERVLRSVAGATRRDGEEFLALAGEIRIRTEVEVYSLAEAGDVLLRLKRREVRGAAVLRVGGGR
ncbi:zinc-dependent alcohol dehydrogenase family protein [Candidatus Bipolaricaulota bacterium]|nr:zinc-dependent alcohol dehydrogenase family protein [Candidatus Bipolaricaulota bacterium]